MCARVPALAAVCLHGRELHAGGCLAFFSHGVRVCDKRVLYVECGGRK
jgi:hypothetical protein